MKLNCLLYIYLIYDLQICVTQNYLSQLFWCHVLPLAEHEQKEKCLSYVDL